MSTHSFGINPCHLKGIHVTRRAARIWVYYLRVFNAFCRTMGTKARLFVCRACRDASRSFCFVVTFVRYFCTEVSVFAKKNCANKRTIQRFKGLNYWRTRILRLQEIKSSYFDDTDKVAKTNS